ncbi:hypothetical protein [Plantactinospora endophytica]|uniref:Secreted protein n=1 Tax=Plantactinospora endophytica TaxID=673535 RepID=A0ABQ4DWY5_9ACTN|nr:hypothetical protein [Plantactinospora endophytica]GIG86960.1 hypothetical protein Pen02_18960 [Plantactinospora endophytica]
MRGIKQTLATTAAVAITATGLAVTGTATPAQAAECRTHPLSGYVGMTREQSGTSGAVTATTWRTTAKCQDIQVRGVLGASGGRRARWYDVCVIFIDRTSACNYWSRIRLGHWTNVATNVRDGVSFKLRVRVPVGADIARGQMDF